MKDFEEPPPAELSDRILRRLRREGLVVAPTTRPRWTWLAAAAAATALAFVAGFHAASRESDETRYLLLLYGAPAARSDGRVEEYRAWAVEQRRAGREVSGERLGASETVLGDAAAPSGLRLLGFFLVSAEDDAEAAEAARTHPHLRHGGVVVVRPIDPT